MFARGNRIYLRIKQIDGSWKNVSTGLLADDDGWRLAELKQTELEQAVSKSRKSSAKPQKLPSGRWRIRWFDADGKCHSETYDTEASATIAITNRKTFVAKSFRMIVIGTNGLERELGPFEFEPGEGFKRGIGFVDGEDEITVYVAIRSNERAESGGIF